MGNYFKYNTCHPEQHPARQPELLEKLRFMSTYFPYDQKPDEFICPAQNRMVYIETQPYKSKHDFLSQRRIYECLVCSTCPLKPQCTKAKGKRQMQVGFELRRYRQQAKDNLLSEQGMPCENYVALNRKQSSEM